MDITIIGTGNMARGIATRALAGGNRVTLLGTSIDKARRLADELSGDVRAGQVGDPLAGDVVVLAVWYPAVDDVLRRYADPAAAVHRRRRGGAWPGAAGERVPCRRSAPASVFVPAGADVDAVRGALEDAPGAASVGAGREGPPGTLLTVVLDGDPYAPGTVDQIPSLRTAVGEDALVGGPTAQE